MMGLFASRICGSADLYSNSGKSPGSSINFVTCHDGFTLNDLVSYQHKHNEANAEDNHDGTNEDFSGNYGVEGATKDAGIEFVRKRQIKNFLLTLLVSRGVPMLLGGDEFRRTHGGNNNAYCQDNETSWIDWTDLEKNQEIYRFARGMIAFRSAHPVLSEEQFYTDAGIRWFGPTGELPNWTDPKEKQFACLIQEEEQRALCLMFNADANTADFRLPPMPSGAQWHLAVDTFGQTPRDLFAVGEEPLLQYPQTYLLKPRSSAILLVRKPQSSVAGGSK
jgi:glycogen operon protein